MAPGAMEPPQHAERPSELQLVPDASKQTKSFPVGNGAVLVSRFGRDSPSRDPLIQKVGFPSSEPYHDDLMDLWREINPFNSLKGKQGRWLFLEVLWMVFPCLEWMSKYKWRAYLRGDIIAGLTIAIMAIPQDLAYAQLAKLPPINGLYTSLLPPLVYAIFGSSRHIAIGPVAVVSLLMGDLLPRQVSPLTEPAKYLAFASLTTFWVGVLQSALGFARLGFLIEFLSHSTIVGFMAGAAITIGMSQLKSFCGYTSKNFTNKTNVQSVIGSLIHNRSEFNWQTFLIGSFFLAVLMTSKEFARRWKKLWILPALAPLCSVIAATLFCYVTKVNKIGVKILGKVPEGLPPITHLDFSITSDAMPAALIVTFVALTEAVSIARTFAYKNGYHINGSQEMRAFGFSNIVGSLTSSYVATGSFSRSAVNEASGASTALTNMIMTVVIGITLLLLTPLFYYLPQTVLSAIIISALFGLVDIRGIKLTWKTDKLDFICLAGAFFGVLFVSVEVGILIAVSISLAKVILKAVRPHTAILGRIADTKVYRSIKQYPNAQQEAGMLIIRFDAAMFFANSFFMKERVLTYVENYKSLNKAHSACDLLYVILDMSPVSSIDVTAALSLKELHADLERRGYRLALSNPSLDVVYRLQRAEVIEAIGSEWMFVSVVDAVEVCSSLVHREQELDVWVEPDARKRESEGPHEAAV